MNRRNRINNVVGLSGWLFADLVLALFIVLLQQQIVSTNAVSTTPLAPVSTITSTPLPATSTLSPNPSETSTAIVIGPVVEQTAAPTPEPTRTPTVSLSQVPIEFTLKANANALLAGDGAIKQRELVRIKEEINQLWDEKNVPKNARAGLVLTFGHSSKDDFNQGRQMASEVNAALKAALPNVFDNPVMRDYHYIDAQGRGLVDVEVFLFVNE